jgi:hypothetical protein
VALAGAGGSQAGSLGARLTEFVARFGKVRTVGRVPKFSFELPPVGGAALELEVSGDYPDQRYLDLAATSTAGKVRERLFEGAHDAARTLVTSPDLKARIDSTAKKLVESLRAQGS